MDQEIIKIRGLNVWYNGFHALKNINTEIPSNQITALIGASGSGKSTFLRSINRMLDFALNTRISGEILFSGENILGEHIDVISLRRKIGMLFQNPSPFPKSIFDNIAYGLEVQGVMKKKSSSWWNFFRNVKIVAEELEKSDHPIDVAVVKSLKDAALWDEVKDRLHQSAFKLSGGQQQRLCIARAIAVRPEILLLDEPCSDLDPISTRKIEELLLQLKKSYTIIIVTHNMHQAKRISDFTGFFHLGELLEFGKTKNIFENPNHKTTMDYVMGNFG
ncbi:MAG: phosphate ABC transporter ATP-binding protein [Candidatus Paceibacterota bacterium]